MPCPWADVAVVAGLTQGYEEAGTDLAQVLTAKESMAKKKAAMPAEIAKALARLSSGLYVVSAANNSARSAMIASWVSQASFQPLGLTIAVAKDRAIESLMQVRAAARGLGACHVHRPGMTLPQRVIHRHVTKAHRGVQVGDTFVLNCLGEGDYSPIMKHFLKRFPAGADRFEGVGWFPAANGSPVLEDSIAYLECKVRRCQVQECERPRSRCANVPAGSCACLRLTAGRGPAGEVAHGDA